jgi:alpha-beta hydrolase superfamily lysophospholipase
MTKTADTTSADPTRRSFPYRLARRVVRSCIRGVLFLLSIPVIILVAAAFDARGKPDLQAWHTYEFEHQFRAEDGGPEVTLADYLEREDRIFEELETNVFSPKTSETTRLNRYTTDSLSDPRRFERNWNRTYELVPDEIRGGALLLHGLTDSPYSFRSVAEALHGEGFYVLCLRMPGHGTTPGSLASAVWPDWMAAVHIGARHVRQRIGGDRPFYIGGYSNGGALATRYAIDTLADADLPRPDRVILFSPAIGVTAFARFAAWHRALSWMSYFEKFQWQGIEPECDPFKYNSFPMNAGRQSWVLGRHVQSGLAAARADGTIGDLPPILTFQSLVDTTVLVTAVVNTLYGSLEADGSELIMVDVNRRSYLEQFMTADHRSPFAHLRNGALPYRLTFLTNRSDTSRDIMARTRMPGPPGEVEDENLDLAWPRDVSSLSHVAIPFPEDDPVYGLAVRGETPEHFRAHYLQFFGERGLLSISAANRMRIRHNPFFPYVRDRIVELARRDAAEAP